MRGELYVDILMHISILLYFQFIALYRRETKLLHILDYSTEKLIKGGLRTANRI